MSTAKGNGKPSARERNRRTAQQAQAQAQGQGQAPQTVQVARAQREAAQALDALRARQPAALPSLDPDREALAMLDASIPELEAKLADAREKLDEAAAAEAAKIKTPLALGFLLTSCRFATLHDPTAPGDIMPSFSFETIPCVQGKSAPDQDCRTCQYVHLIPLGFKAAPHEQRYLGAGLVFPIKDEEQARKVATALDMLEITHARHPEREIKALEAEIKTRMARRDEIARRIEEEHQAGRLGR